MSNGFEKLKEIGAQKIHEQTHIPKEYTYAIVDRNFQNMNKIQFLGFMSILEREYSIKLDDLKNEAIDYFEENTKTFTISKKVFLPAKKRKSFSKYYILLAVFILIFVALSNSSTVEKSIDAPKIDIDKIAQASLDMATQIEEPVIIEDIPVSKTLKIIPDVELWMSYVNLNTGKKYQKVFSDELELDGDEHWLIKLGHGKVTFDINGGVDKYKSSRTLRFEYKNGNLKKLSYSEYSRLNKGKKW